MRVLVLSADMAGGHDTSARAIAATVAKREAALPDAEVSCADLTGGDESWY
jgi:hypothetical protein